MAEHTDNFLKANPENNTRTVDKYIRQLQKTAPVNPRTIMQKQSM